MRHYLLTIDDKTGAVTVEPLTPESTADFAQRWRTREATRTRVARWRSKEKDVTPQSVTDPPPTVTVTPTTVTPRTVTVTRDATDLFAVNHLDLGNKEQRLAHDGQNGVTAHAALQEAELRRASNRRVREHASTVCLAETKVILTWGKRNNSQVDNWNADQGEERCRTALDAWARAYRENDPMWRAFQLGLIITQTDALLTRRSRAEPAPARNNINAAHRDIPVGVMSQAEVIRRMTRGKNGP